MNMSMDDQEQRRRQQPSSYHFIDGKATGLGIKCGNNANDKITSRIQVQSRYNGSIYESPKLRLAAATAGTSSIYSKMITQKTIHLIPQDQQQQPYSSRISSSGSSSSRGSNSSSSKGRTTRVDAHQHKSITSIPSLISLDKLRESSSSKQEDAEDIASVISNIVGRIYEDSVASDVSGLMDADVFEANQFLATTGSTSSSTNTNTSMGHSTVSFSNKNCRSVVRAPEPPALSHGSSKFTDIQSDSTVTTVGSEHDEKITKNNNKKRSVSFCEVQVRNYERVLTVNASVTSGPAVGLGWNYSPEEDEIFSLEHFEDNREYTRRDSMQDLALPRGEREDLLLSLGYTQREIAGSIRQILRLKNQRKQTIQNLHVSSMEEFMEKATRKMKRVLLFPLSANRKKANTQLSIYPRPLSTAKTLESSVLRKTSLIHPSAT